MTTSIRSFSKNPDLLSALQNLPEKEFSVIGEGTQLPDVVIVDENYLDLPEYLHSFQTILFVEDAESLHQVFQLTHEKKIATVVTKKDLQNLASIITDVIQTSTHQDTDNLIQSKSLGMISFHGGVGKSFTSLHLVYFLSHLLKQPCLLIDCSTPLSPAREYLKYPVHQTWETLKPLLKEAGQLSNERLKTTVDHTPFGFDFLAGSDHTNQQMSRDELSLLLDAAEKTYPIVIVDLPTNSDLSQVFNSTNRQLINIMSPESLVSSLKWLNQVSMTSKTKQFWIVNKIHSPQEIKVISSLSNSVAAEFLGTIDEDLEAVIKHKKTHQLIIDPQLLLTDQFQSISKELIKRCTNL